MLYAKLSNVYTKGENKVVRYDITGDSSSINEYLEQNPKSVDSVTGKPIYNQTIRPDSKVKTYVLEGELKKNTLNENYYVDRTAMENAFMLATSAGLNPIELIKAMTGIQGIGSSSRRQEPQDIEATNEGLDNI